MAFGRSRVVEVTRGEAEVTWLGARAGFEYEIAGDPALLRSRDRLRCVMTMPERAEEFFRAREGRTTIGGRDYRVEALAHTAGEDRVWAEIML